MKKFINQLPITQMKIFVARMLYKVVHLFYRQDKRIIIRDGINYEIDLSEGIDLSLFLFGDFQKHVTHNKYISLPPNAIIFDVGANIGVMSLQFAKAVPSGKVYSFEPTFYAYSKLQKNLELNPQLAKQITVTQTFVSSTSSAQLNINAYSSWKIGGVVQGQKHKVHGGIAKPTQGIGSVSLDGFCITHNIQRLDFIKIDTDGHEFEVLNGACGIIKEFKPTIIFEIGLYVLNEHNIQFSSYVDFFDALNYSMYDSKKLKQITLDNYRDYIPLKGTVDVLAMPSRNA